MARKQTQSHGIAALRDADEINEALGGIGIAKLWEGKRIYLNLHGLGYSEPKLWVELATGELMEQEGRWGYSGHGGYGTDDDILAQAISIVRGSAS